MAVSVYMIDLHLFWPITVMFLRSDSEAGWTTEMEPSVSSRAWVEPSASTQRHTLWYQPDTCPEWTLVKETVWVVPMILASLWQITASSEHTAQETGHDGTPWALRTDSRNISNQRYESGEKFRNLNVSSTHFQNLMLWICISYVIKLLNKIALSPESTHRSWCAKDDATWWWGSISFTKSPNHHHCHHHHTFNLWTHCEKHLCDLFVQLWKTERW